MKKLLYLALCSCAFTACDDPESDGFEYLTEDTIFSESNQESLKDLLLTFTVTGSDPTHPYLAVDRLVDVHIDINGQTWTQGPTLEEDVTTLNTDTVQNLPFASEPVEYVFIGQFIQRPISFTAGAYAEVLNGFLRLSPGDYVCEVNQLSFLTVTGDTVTLNPRITEVFEVAAGERSAHVGSFTVQLD